MAECKDAVTSQVAEVTGIIQSTSLKLLPFAGSNPAALIKFVLTIIEFWGNILYTVAERSNAEWLIVREG